MSIVFQRVPFRMHRSGWLIVVFCIIIGALFSGWSYAPQIGLLLLASLLLHEAGHMLMAMRLGVPVREFGLRMGGAYIRRACAKRRRDEILISAAGPLMNLLLTVPALYLHHIGAQIALCNFLLGIVNLLPLPSSDGLRILRNVFNTQPQIQPAPNRA